MKLTGQVQNVILVQLTILALTVTHSVKPAQLGTVVILGRRSVWDTLQDRTVLFVSQGGMGVDVIFIVILTVHCGLVMNMEVTSATERELVCKSFNNLICIDGILDCAN